MPLDSLNFNLLVHLDALLTEKHVTRAAERASVSQSAMSLALARVRRHYKDDLLQQRGNQMVPTPLAMALAAPVRAAMQQILGVATCSVETDPAKFDRRVVLAATLFSAEYVLSKAVPLISAVAPRLRLDCQTVTDRTEEEFERGLIDFRILSHSVAPPRHPSETIYINPIVCVAWSGNTLVGDSMSLEQLQEVGFVRVKFPGGIMPSFENWFNANIGNLRRIEIQTSSYALGLRLIPGTQRIMFCNQAHLSMYGLEDQLRVIAVPFHIPPAHTVLQWHRDADSDPVITWFRAVLRQAVKGEAGPPK